MQSTPEIDLLVEADWLLPVEPADVVLENHAVAIDGGRIVEVLPTNDAAQRFSPRSRKRLDGHVLIPGLINLHTHAAMALFRGLADDLALMDWLSNHIWPAEGRYISEQFIYDGTLLACAEMLKGGVTCFNDMYFFPEQAGRAALDAGMRACLGIVLIEFPTPYASDAQDYLRKGIAARDSLKGEELMSFCMAPHAPYTVSDASFEQVVTLAEQLDLPIHVHLHETENEITDHLKQYGVRPLERVQRLGLLGPRLIAVHAVHLDDMEIARLAAQGCSVAHCPASNLKLASGFARVGDLLEAGVNIGIGTDGAASNNRLDILGELRLAALVSKTESGNAETMSAHAALRMATLDGAKALGMDQHIGSIKPDKYADLTAVNLADALELAPWYDPASHLVYAAGREHVTHVWVQGEEVVTNGHINDVDQQQLLAKARSWQRQIAATD
ncbi:MAG: TRZ/ATZ family hydrolase [Betaproteobacteria bacterium]|nr:MAG: TRZ/ATZ family hydrolase [Betaproteobacteria bacterium]